MSNHREFGGRDKPNTTEGSVVKDVTRKKPMVRAASHRTTLRGAHVGPSAGVRIVGEGLAPTERKQRKLMVIPAMVTSGRVSTKGLRRSPGPGVLQGRTSLGHQPKSSKVSAGTTRGNGGVYRSMVRMGAG